MKGLNLTTTPIRAKDTPFVMQRDVVAMNLGVSAVTVTGSDTQTGTFAEIASVPAGGIANVTLTPWFRTGSDTLIILGGV